MLYSKHFKQESTVNETDIDCTILNFWIFSFIFVLSYYILIQLSRQKEGRPLK